MPMEPENLIGKTFGRLLVTGPVRRRPDNRYEWLCTCECGKERYALAKLLKNGMTKSCGCLRGEGNNYRHGKCKSHIYYNHKNMMNRCYNPNVKSYKYYGQRGIKVAKVWHKFKNFLADMESTWFPEATLDRINPKKGYSKSNCRWLTRADNLQHRWES